MPKPPKLSPKAFRDIQRVLDIAYGRDVALDALEQTVDVSPFVPPIEGVFRIEVIHDEMTFWHAPELSVR
jgi:hypothetical protein